MADVFWLRGGSMIVALCLCVYELCLCTVSVHIVYAHVSAQIWSGVSVCLCVCPDVFWLRGGSLWSVCLCSVYVYVWCLCVYVSAQIWSGVSVQCLCSVCAVSVQYLCVYVSVRMCFDWEEEVHCGLARNRFGISTFRGQGAFVKQLSVSSFEITTLDLVLNF